MSFLSCFLMKRKEDMSIYWNKITTKFVGGKKRCLKLGFLTFSCKFVSFYLMDKLINGKRKYTLFIGRIYFVIIHLRSPKIAALLDLHSFSQRASR